MHIGLFKIRKRALKISSCLSHTLHRYVAILSTSGVHSHPFQLYVPLNQLGYIYRSVNQSLVDTERLLALLNEPTEVNDKPNAPDLVVTDGEIEFGVYLVFRLNKVIHSFCSRQRQLLL